MIRALLDFLRTLTDPERLIALISNVLTGWLGYGLLFGVIFAETGLLTGFFLPGDSLLFTVGVVAGAGKLNLPVIILTLIAAALIGDSTGYLLGRRTGELIFSRPDSRLFKKKYVARTQAFYSRYGGRTMIYAKFVPIVRTFAPFMAGVGKMNYLRFLSYDVFGAVAWVTSLTVLGNYLGSVPLVRRHFEKAVFLIIVLSLLPVLREAYAARKKRA
ncbi:MAG: VTT domain-containing protein [Bryobacterales bacterium]|nr:VTT domain-containing protein [Bryobacterales bacterium]